MVAKFENINKIFCTSAGTFNGNDDSCINLNKGEIVLISEQSEYSNESKLSLMGCLINPNDGILEINGKNINVASYEELAIIKLQSIGFVLHKHRLIENINAEENVAFPLKIENLKPEEIKQKTSEVLKSVAMYQHRKKMPKQLSKLETQQIQIARALITNPEIIICEKPTSFLDRQSGVLIMEKLKELSKLGKTIVLLNHDSRFNYYADRTVNVKNGIINEHFMMH